MKNFVQRGDTITLAAPADVASGDPIMVGSIFGVCAETASTGATVDLLTVGVYDLPLSAGPVTLGAPLYWDTAAKKLTTTADGNAKVGEAVLAAQAGAATVRARLNGAF